MKKHIPSLNLNTSEASAKHLQSSPIFKLNKVQTTFLPEKSPSSSSSNVNSPSSYTGLVSTPKSALSPRLMGNKFGANINQEIKVIKFSPVNNVAALEELCEVSGVTVDFIQRMIDMSKIHFTIISFRLGSAEQGINRRFSLGDGVYVICSPKETNTVTKTNPYDTLCYGHIPRNKKFAAKTYNLQDDNNAGNFPEDILDRPSSDEEDKLLEFLREHDSSIIQLKMYSNLICYASIVEPPIESGEHVKTVLKHYIQEAESLASLLDRFKRGVYTFESVINDALYFFDQAGNSCKMDLASLTAGTHLSFPLVLTDINVLEKDIVQNDILNSHGPIYYESSNNIFLPVMVLAGDNGFHITGDLDPQHICARADLPALIYKTFSGKSDDPLKFIIGLKLLRARLTLTKELLNEFTAKIKTELSGNPDILDAYKSFLKPCTSSYYKDYLNDETDEYYYRNKYIPMVENALAHYQ